MYLTLAEEILPSVTTFTMLVAENSAMTIINKRNPLELTMSVSEKIATEFRTDPASLVLSAWLIWLRLPPSKQLRQTRLLLFHTDGHYLEVPSGAVQYVYSVYSSVHSNVIYSWHVFLL